MSEVCSRCGEKIPNGFIAWSEHMDKCIKPVMYNTPITIEMLDELMEKLSENFVEKSNQILVDEGDGYIPVIQSRLFNEAMKKII